MKSDAKTAYEFELEKQVWLRDEIIKRMQTVIDKVMKNLDNAEKALKDAFHLD